MNVETPSTSSRLHALLTELVLNLVDDEAAVHVSANAVKEFIVFEVTVNPKDFGKLVGHNGVTSQSLRRIVQSVGRKHKVTALVEFKDPRKEGNNMPQTGGLTPE